MTIVFCFLHKKMTFSLNEKINSDNVHYIISGQISQKFLFALLYMVRNLFLKQNYSIEQFLCLMSTFLQDWMLSFDRINGFQYLQCLSVGWLQNLEEWISVASLNITAWPACLFCLPEQQASQELPMLLGTNHSGCMCTTFCSASYTDNYTCNNTVIIHVITL